MADALSVASSLIALATFAFEASKSLYTLVEGFKNTQRTVRELRRQATVASAVIDQYKTMIEEATSDLQEHLQNIEERCIAEQHGSLIKSEALQARLMELTNRLRQMSEQGIMYKDPTNLNLIKEERESIIKCLNVCSEASDLAHRARTNIFEDVTSSDESHQLVVSTIGDLISAKHIITGSKSAQWLGQMSDTSLQQLSRDFRGQVGIGEEPRARAEKNEFNTRYGSGQLLGEDSPRRRTSPSDKR
ncbi:hypothetical protein AAWM_08779 [Aspergillus awamori]|uniref:Azaphilone pigments biosynthesis cluster protein L N-terminal domain-containing protein n=1 Tax=Aspergillus awamori TaxID=105351 RepID=A0A401L2Y9_ASPAW|nr:hypothetical protein AAWM_08779 [Aspergillus awamori]